MRPTSRGRSPMPVLNRANISSAETPKQLKTRICSILQNTISWETYLVTVDLSVICKQILKAWLCVRGGVIAGWGLMAKQNRQTSKRGGCEGKGLSEAENKMRLKENRQTDRQKVLEVCKQKCCFQCCFLFFFFFFFFFFSVNYKKKTKEDKKKMAFSKQEY